jgi:hypothetical protein
MRKNSDVLCQSMKLKRQKSARRKTQGLLNGLSVEGDAERQQVNYREFLQFLMSAEGSGLEVND